MPEDQMMPGLWRVLGGMLAVILAASLLGAVVQAGLRLGLPGSTPTVRAAIGWSVTMGALAAGWFRWGELRTRGEALGFGIVAGALAALVAWVLP